MRFRVEASDDAVFGKAVTVADQTKEDYRNPGDNPVLFKPSGVRPGTFG